MPLDGADGLTTAALSSVFNFSTPWAYAITTTTTTERLLLSTSLATAKHVAVVGWPSIILIVVMALLSVLTVFGNLIVLLSYYLDKTIRQPSNYFIFSLAVSDLIIGLEGFPVYTYFFINDQRWTFGAFICDLWLSIDYSCCLASIYTVLGITVDRYCSVKYPAAYRNWRTQSRILLIIAATWIIPSLLFSFSIFGYGFFSGRGRILREDECYVQFMTNAYLNMGMYVAYYWSTLFLMLYLYYGIYSAAKQLASKSDQKHKRLAVLSDMRTRASCKKEAVSTIGGVSGISNSALESPHSSDSVYPRTNHNCASTSLNATDNGKLLPGSAPSVEQDKSTVTAVADKSTTAEKDQTSAPFPSSCETIEKDPATGAFQVDDDLFNCIPFIDEGASNSSYGLVSEQSEGIIIDLEGETFVNPLVYQLSFPKTPGKYNSNNNIAAFFNNNNTIVTPSPPSPPLNVTPNNITNSASVKSLNKSNDVERQATLLHNHHHRNSSTKTDRPEVPEDNNNISSNNLCQRKHTITPKATEIEVVIQKESNGGGPLRVRRLLTAIEREVRSQSSRITTRAKSKRAERRKMKKMTKNVQSRSENRARKALRTITIILGSFTVFWTPFYVLATIYGFCERCSSSPNFNLLYAISYYLCYVNSPLNPICYAMANQQFKRTFKRILKGDLRRT